MIASVNPLAECHYVSTRDRQACDIATAALATSSYSALRKLTCRAADGVVEITGSVSSFYLKQLAQAAVLEVSPGVGVRNLVHVHGESQVFVALECGPGPAHCGA